MTWIKLDDAFAEHPKIVALSDAAFRLHVSAMCYCGRWNTDGRIPKGALKTPARYLRELVDSGRWHAHGHECETCPQVEPGAHYVHDFLVYNPSSDEVDEAQGRRSEKARRAARARWDKSPTNGASGNAPSMPQAMLGRCLADAPVPVPKPVPHHQPVGEPPDQPPVDDDDIRIEQPPIDPVDITVRAVLERCADARMRTATPQNPAAYRAKVIAELAHTEGARLRKLIAEHDGAPVDCLAGELLGEPNHLADYRTART